jgi:sugar porter (SP) family MFS transporter
MTFPMQRDARIAASGKSLPAFSAGQILAIAICSLGGTIFGYDIGALSAATQGLLHSFALSQSILGMTVSASLWGGACGSVLAGDLVDRFGRRSVLAACATLYGLSASWIALPAFCPWTVLVMLRFLCGIAIGGFVVDCPLYLAEIAPRALRGRVVGFFQVQIGAGVVMAFAVSAFISLRFAGPTAWRWCLSLGALPPLFLLALLRWVPEEPHWLASRGKRQEADAAARRLGMLEMDWSRVEIPLKKPLLFFQQDLFHPRYLRPLLLATSIAAFNQLTGVNVFRVYLLDLLSSTGMGHITSHLYAISILLLNISVTLTALSLVDRMGRKPLLIVGSAGICLCLVLLHAGMRHHAPPMFYLVNLAAYNGFFAVSQGPLIWVYLSELFPFSVRGAGQGYGSLVHWVTSATVIWSFPVLQKSAPNLIFLIFALIMCLQIVLVLTWYPETKGTHLGKITKQNPEKVI